jgi:hypothetical protein
VLLSPLEEDESHLARIFNQMLKLSFFTLMAAHTRTNAGSNPAPSNGKEMNCSFESLLSIAPYVRVGADTIDSWDGGDGGTGVAGGFSEYVLSLTVSSHPLLFLPSYP